MMTAQELIAFEDEVAARFNAGDRSRSDINLDVTLLARRNNPQRT